MTKGVPPAQPTQPRDGPMAAGRPRLERRHTTGLQPPAWDAREGAGPKGH